METKSHQIEFVNLIQFLIKNTADQVDSQPYTEESVHKTVKYKFTLLYQLQKLKTEMCHCLQQCK